MRITEKQILIFMHYLSVFSVTGMSLTEEGVQVVRKLREEIINQQSDEVIEIKD